MSDDPAPGERDAPVRFMLDVDADPALLSRLLAPFARRSLIPDRMWSHKSGRIMHIEIAMEAMPEAAVPVVEGNLRQVVGVHNITRLRPERQRNAA